MNRRNRMIPKLKQFNTHSVFHHFEIESINHAVCIIKTYLFTWHHVRFKICILLHTHIYKTPKILKLLSYFIEYTNRVLYKMTMARICASLLIQQGSFKIYFRSIY